MCCRCSLLEKENSAAQAAHTDGGYRVKSSKELCKLEDEHMIGVIDATFDMIQSIRVDIWECPG